MQSLVFDPLIPIALWGSLALVAAGLVTWYSLHCVRRLGRRRGGLVSLLMLVSMALPLAMLLNPTWHERIPPPAGKPVVSVLVDASRSMSTTDGKGGQQRIAEAAALARAMYQELSDRYDVALYSFDSAPAPADVATLSGLKPRGEFTDYAESINALIQSDQPAGQAVVLLSDGIQNVGGEAAVLKTAARAKTFSVPVYTRTIGRDTGVRDLAVEVFSPQDLAFVGQKTPIRVELSPHGLAGGVAHVSLWLDERQLEARDVPLGGDEAKEIEFPVTHDASGVFRYEVRAEPLTGEATEVNNNCTYVLRVIDEPIRMLLLEGKPYWDTKFLMRTMASDPSVELTSVVRLAEGRYLERNLKRPAAEKPAGENPAAAADSAPASGKDASAANEGKPRAEDWKLLKSPDELLADDDALSKFQVVVLGRDAESYLTDAVLARLSRWLAREGGSLVCFRGTPTAHVNHRLRGLLPVRSNSARETRFHVKLTSAGKELRWISTADADSRDDADPLSRLPSLATRSEVLSPQPMAVVWATGDTSGGPNIPVVTSMPLGTGRVVVVEGAGMWRWAFMAPQYDRHEQFYATIWQSLTRWLVTNTGLMPTQTWALRSDKVRFTSTEPATASLLVRADAASGGPPPIELTGEALDAPQAIIPVAAGEEVGAYRVMFGKLPEGRYRAKVVGSAEKDSAAHAVFDVRSNVDELLHLEAKQALMARLATLSGGAELKTDMPQEVAKLLESHLAKTRPEQIRQTPAWDRWWALVGILAIWCMTWGVRRSSGLV